MADFASRRRMMVDNQVRPSDVTKYPIIDALLAVERQRFVPQHLREAAYLGEVLELGEGRVLLEPRTFAKMLDALDLKQSDMVLDLGCGYGYSSAVLAQMVEAVIAVESDANLAEEARALLSEVEADNVFVEHAPLTEGAPQHGPYDAIILEGGAEAIPQAIVDQLKEGGRMAAIFLDGKLGEVRIGYKVGGRMNWRFAFNAHSPLTEGFEREHGFVL